MGREEEFPSQDNSVYLRQRKETAFCGRNLFALNFLCDLAALWHIPAREIEARAAPGVLHQYPSRGGLGADV